MLKKTHGPVGQTTSLSLKEYMRIALAEENPLKVSRVVQAVAGGVRASENESSLKLLRLVDWLIVADEEYMSAIEGVQCAFVQSILYTDKGKAKEAW